MVQTLLKSAKQHFFQIVLSLRGKWSWKISLFMRSEILRLLVNKLTADDKYFLHNSENLCQPIQMQLSKKEKKFSESFASFLKPTSNFEHFQKQNLMTVIPYTLPNLRTAKDAVR